MKPNLLYLQDFYRRWWWAYLLGFIIFAGVGAGFSYSKTHSALPMAGGAFLGAVLLATELNFRTNARTLLTLPMSLQELSASLWFISVPLSSMFITGATAAGTLIAAAAGAKHPLNASELLLFMLLTMAVSAFMLVVLTFLMHRPPENAGEQMIAALSGGAWGLGISAGFSAPMFMKSANLSDPLSLGILLTGMVCAVVSWYRCRTMLRNRAYGMGTAKPAARASTSLPAGGMNGLSWLFVRTFGTAIGFSVVMQLFMQLILRLMHAPVRGQTVSMLVFFPLFFISIMLLQPQMTALRHWRSLPLTSSQLALLYLGLCLITIGGALTPLALYVLLDGSFSAPWLSFPLLVFGTGLFCLLVSFIMHFGIKWAMFLPMLVIPALVVVPYVMSIKEIPWSLTGSPLTLLAGLLLVWAAYQWNLRTIRKRSRVYQSNFHLLGRMQMGG